MIINEKIETLQKEFYESRIKQINEWLLNHEPSHPDWHQNVEDWNYFYNQVNKDTRQRASTE